MEKDESQMETQVVKRVGNQQCMIIAGGVGNISLTGFKVH